MACTEHSTKCHTITQTNRSTEKRRGSNAATPAITLAGVNVEIFNFAGTGRDSKPQQSDFLDLKTTAVEEQPRRGLKRDEVASSTNDSHSKRLKTITLDEVAWHDTLDNCWVVIHDFVYDCTELLSSHPGGADVILEYAGRDATLAFVGTGHSNSARGNLERFLIGELPPEERIFRVKNGVKIFGF
ncbi:cytochrome b5 [Xylocopa sonorina]|uniref:cytochrome b5 n=1 Tax=Xylocopa sonorina TaxID=1818115 RepID=UPI00403AA444